MKVFHCDHCQQLVFFENVSCVKCGHTLAYLPDIDDMASLEPAEGDTGGHGREDLSLMRELQQGKDLQLGRARGKRRRYANLAA